METHRKQAELSVLQNSNFWVFRMFLMACCLPFFFSISICSMCISILYLSLNTQTHYTIEILRLIVTFSSSQIRNAFLFTVLERMFATARLETYTLDNKTTLFWRLTIFSYLFSTVYIGYTIFGELSSNLLLFRGDISSAENTRDLTLSHVEVGISESQNL